MSTKQGRAIVLALAAILLLLTLGRGGVSLYTDLLWFREVGYTSVFRTRLLAGATVLLAAAALGALVLAANLWRVTRVLGPVRVRRRYGNLEIAEQIPRRMVIALIVIVALLSGWWIASANFGGPVALQVLAAMRRHHWGLADPLFGHDVGFYVFVLPLLLRLIDYLLVLLVWSGVLVTLGYVLVGSIRSRPGSVEIDPPARSHFLLLVAGVVLLASIRYWLGRYGLLISGNGFEGALGYADVRARIPARNVVAVLGVATAGTLIWSAITQRWLPSIVSVVVLIVAAVLGGRVYPAVVQKFRVEPNQLAREAPFIDWNLRFTRQAFGLDRLERVRYPFSGPIRPDLASMAKPLASLPLWDPEPLETALNQTQSLFRYYNFPNVDIDRYGPPGATVPVAIAVRELDPDGIPESARTWQTLHLNPQYLRGIGAVVVPAAQMSPQGQPILWTSNIDPVETAPDAPPELAITHPSVYFGELSEEYAILGTTGRAAREEVAPEGIRVGSFLRKLAFAWRFGDRNLLFTGAVTGDSRIVFRRSVSERIREIAPFAVWDPEPESAYPVIAGGRIVWILNGYTASAAFPLSRAVRLGDAGAARYVRHSLKATVDAVTGAVRVYALDPADPLLATFRDVFPGLVRPLTEMPPALASHLRYPTLLLQLQADVLEQYHLSTAEAFYSGQDVWQLPRHAGTTEQSRPYEPMYLMTTLPGVDALEFLLIVPFIARERQNMTALLVARNDAPNFGDLVLLELPRDHQIPGPTQVEAVMEQDPVISPQLSLWRQAGSDVNLGQLRVLPIDSSFLYVEPLFLSAAGSPIPELERIVVSDGRNTAMAPTLETAMQSLQGVAPDAAAAPRGAPRLPAAGAGWSRRALEMLDQAERYLRQGEWGRFGEALESLRQYLRSAGEAAPGAGSTAPRGSGAPAPAGAGN